MLDEITNKAKSSDFAYSKQSVVPSSGINTSYDSHKTMSEDEKILLESKRFENYLNAMKNIVPRFVENENSKKIINLMEKLKSANARESDVSQNKANTPSDVDSQFSTYLKLQNDNGN